MDFSKDEREKRVTNSRGTRKWLLVLTAAGIALSASLSGHSASALDDVTQVPQKQISDVVWTSLDAKEIESPHLDVWKYRVNLTEIAFPWIEEGWNENQWLVGHIRISSIKPDGTERDSLTWTIGKDKQNCASAWKWVEPLSHPYNDPSLYWPGTSPECPKRVVDGNRHSSDWGTWYPFSETYMWVHRDPQGPVNSLIKAGPNVQFADLNMKDGDRLMIRPNIVDSDESELGSPDGICDGILYTPPMTLSHPAGGKFTYWEQDGACQIKWWGARVKNP